jgi:hypothetical protein
MNLFTLSAVCATILTPTIGSAQTAPPFELVKCEAAVATFHNGRLPHAVVVNGQPLAAGAYDVRITNQFVAPAVGQSPARECWVEFMTAGTVVGREIASVISPEEIATIVKEPAPASNAARVDVLRGDEYLRVWMNGTDAHYIVNLTIAR